MTKRFHIILIMVSVLSFASFDAVAGVSPSQVLVLYNSDWTEDHPLTAKGQDSKEIAEYYVKMNTDHQTGAKPYILGLSAKYGNLLNHEHLKEKSSDNKAGIVLTHLSRMIGSTYRVRDSRLVEFTLPQNGAGWQFDTLQLQIGPLKAKLSDRIILIENGKNIFPDQVKLRTAGQFTVRFNGQKFLSGSVTVNASCQDKTGRQHRWKAEYRGINNVAVSRTGPDGIQDDKNYLELVEAPIKSFLENPRNALTDGTLLKDHILFFVVCFGLPRTCIAPFGIERGITHAMHNFGSMIDFGQRLQLMYYDLEAVMGSTPRPYRFDSKEAFSTFYFRSPQAMPLFGPKANPFLHPELYAKNSSFDSQKDPVPFGSDARKKYSKRHLYFTMRIDARTPVQAKSLIDRAAYAKKYGDTHMGVLSDTNPSQNQTTTGSIGNNISGPALWAMGYKRIFYRHTSSNRLELFRLPPESGFFNNHPVYLPGGIATTVISHSGWNRKKSDLYKYFDRGVTVSVAAARVYEGAPHIHNKSFWDDAVFYKALIAQKRTIGEALFMNQAHLGWISTFIGDPLYQLPDNNSLNQPKPLAIDSIHIIHLPETQDSVALAVTLASSPEYPQVAQMRIKGNGTNEFICPTFETVPYTILANNIVTSTPNWEISLMDPFGGQIQTTFNFDKLKNSDTHL